MSGDVGCANLLQTVQNRAIPLVIKNCGNFNWNKHIFGHVHESYGVTSDSVTHYVNAAICNSSYNPAQFPIVIDVKK